MRTLSDGHSCSRHTVNVLEFCGGTIIMLHPRKSFGIAEQLAS